MPYGAASLHLVDGVQFLRQDEAVFDAMLDGWSAQMIGGRGLRRETVAFSTSMVRRFQTHVNEWPWRWSAAMFDEWMTDLATVHALKHSTRRGYQLAIRAFCTYVCSPHYGWVAECEERFGAHPTQVSHEDNMVQHLSDFEGSPARRPLTRDELQRLLDRADNEVDVRIQQGRKGAAMAYRDATMFKVQYAWGLRSNELCHLDTTDLFRSPHAKQFEGIGLVQVRMGKASRGGPPKRRTVGVCCRFACVQVCFDREVEAGRMAVMPIKYSEEFKRDAVGLVESGISQKQVCRDLGVSKSALSAWIQDARFQSHGMTPSKDPDEQREMRQALKRIRELEMENEVLRRAAAYLSQVHITPPK